MMLSTFRRPLLVCPRYFLDSAVFLAQPQPHFYSLEDTLYNSTVLFSSCPSLTTSIVFLIVTLWYVCLIWSCCCLSVRAQTILEQMTARRSLQPLLPLPFPISKPISRTFVTSLLLHQHHGITDSKRADSRSISCGIYLFFINCDCANSEGLSAEVHSLVCADRIHALRTPPTSIRAEHHLRGW